MDDDIQTVTVGCPRCRSQQFAIEEALFTVSEHIWVVCRNCNWTMGEITDPNITLLTEPKRKI